MPKAPRGCRLVAADEVDSEGFAIVPRDDADLDATAASAPYPLELDMAWRVEGRSDRAKYEQPYAYQSAVLGTTVALRQRPLERSLGFASTVWDAAVVLGGLIEGQANSARDARLNRRATRHTRGTVADLTVVELAAGVGLPSCVALACGAPHVVATDLPCNLELLDENLRAVRAAAPGAPAQARVAPLDAENAPSALRASINLVPADNVLVLLADGLYTKELGVWFGTLLRESDLLKRALRPVGSAWERTRCGGALVACGRNRAGLSSFHEAVLKDSSCRITRVDWRIWASKVLPGCKASLGKRKRDGDVVDVWFVERVS